MDLGLLRMVFLLRLVTLRLFLEEKVKRRQGKTYANLQRKIIDICDRFTDGDNVLGS